MLGFVITVPADEVELASDALWALGVSAVEERSTGTDGTMVELWTHLGDADATVRRAAEAFPARWRWRTATIDPAVADTWRHHASPSWITGDIVVVPAWQEHDIEADLVVRIDPGSAFGMGDHPTTRLSGRLLAELWWPGATVADLGCGSGVLSVLAARLGAPFVEAVDIAEGAVEATVANAGLNDVGSQVAASTTPISALTGPYDLVVANILAPVLVDVAGDLRRLTAPSGVLIISGVLTGRHDHVLDALSPMSVIRAVDADGWSAVALRH